MEIVSLVQQVEGMIEPDQGEFSTTISTDNHDRTEDIAVLNSDRNDESILPTEHNENTASLTEKRFKIDKNKLEHLLCLGFTVRKIARDGLLGKQLHHNTLHIFMERNQMKSIRNRYASLSDDELRHKISEISKQFPNSGCREIINHLKNLEPPVLLQRDPCQKLLSDVDLVRTARRLSQAIHRR